MDKDTYNVQFKSCSTYVLAGPSKCGKSVWITNLLLNSNVLIEGPIDYIYVFCGSNDQTMTLLKEKFGPKIQFVSGLPKDLNEYIHSGKHGVLVFDDLMSHELTNNTQISEVFTKRSHHENLSVFLVLQNMFALGKERLNFVRNANYIVLFRNPLDQSVPYVMSQRFDPINQRKLADMLIYVMEKHRYVLCDGHQDTKKLVRFRTDLFNGEHMRCFHLK